MDYVIKTLIVREEKKTRIHISSKEEEANAFPVQYYFARLIIFSPRWQFVSYIHNEGTDYNTAHITGHGVVYISGQNVVFCVGGTFWAVQHYL
jgi:hypothetical protein